MPEKPKNVKAAIAVLVLLSIAICPAISECRDNSAITLDFSGSQDAAGVPVPWKLRVNAGTAYARVITDHEGPAVHLRSSKSSFSLERKLNISLKDYPYMNWTWKALTIPARGDLRNKDRNDQVLQMMIAFEGGKVLSYVWDSNAPEGTVTDESIGIPLFITVKVMVVKSGVTDLGKWLSISRNLHEDYKKAFNEEPGEVRGIRVQTNSQYTGSLAEGLVGKIVFSNAL